MSWFSRAFNEGMGGVGPGTWGCTHLSLAGDGILVEERLVAHHVLVDKPLGEGLALDLTAAVVEDVLTARVGAAAVTLLDTRTVDAVRLAPARVVGGLGLVMPEPGAAWGGAVVEPVARWHAHRPGGPGRKRGVERLYRLTLPPRVRRVAESFELDKPRGVLRVVELLADR